jgi:hypothetical protein
MNRYRYFAWAAYLVALSLILIPIMDAAAETWPLHFSNAQWRFGALGLLSNALMMPSVGILIVLGVAIAAEHDRFLRLSGWLCAVCAALVVFALAAFVLDAIQTRVNVRPEALTSFLVASMTAAGKMILVIVTLVTCAIAGTRTARTTAPQRSARPATVLVAPTSRMARRA